MRHALFALTIVCGVSLSAATPTSSAEYRKLPGETGAANPQLRSTPDIGNSNGDVNTDPAMAGSVSGDKPATADGNNCRSGGGQSYPNANTDNPPGLQPCPQ